MRFKTQYNLCKFKISAHKAWCFCKNIQGKNPKERCNIHTLKWLGVGVGWAIRLKQNKIKSSPHIYF